MKKITLTKKHCTRCDGEFWGKVDNETDKEILPRNCPHCNSTYWNKEITRPKMSQRMRKKK